MKRHPALQDLSREHYDALKLARDASSAAKSGEIAAAAFAAHVVRKFEQELEAHFREEESELLPFLSTAGDSELVWRTLAEHAELRALAAGLRQPDAATLLRFSERLAAHVRFEERTLFEQAQMRGFKARETTPTGAVAPAAVPRQPAACACH